MSTEIGKTLWGVFCMNLSIPYCITTPTLCLALGAALAG